MRSQNDDQKLFFVCGLLFIGSWTGSWVYYAVTGSRYGSGIGTGIFPWPVWLPMIAFLFWFAENRLVKLAFATFFVVTCFRLIAPWLSVARIAWWTGEVAVPLIGILLVIGATPRWTQSRIAIAVTATVAIASFRYFANGYADEVFGRTSVMTGQ